MAKKLYSAQQYIKKVNSFKSYIQKVKKSDDSVETIRVHIRHLRSKVEKISGDKKYIETIYGGGYKLNI